MKKIVFLLLLLFAAAGSFAQVDEDSCSKVIPKYTATFEGITARGMLSPEDISKIKKLLSEEIGITIIRFTYLIDCGEDCEDAVEKTVFGDTFAEDDLKALQGMKSRNVLSLQCILGKDSKGELVAFKPFLYYIR